RPKKTTKGYGISRGRSEDPGQRRKLKPATKSDHKLRMECITKSLTVGSLHANIKRTLNEGQESKETRDVCDAIMKATDQVDTLCSILYEVVALDIDTIMGPRYKIDTSSTAEELTSVAFSSQIQGHGPASPASSSSHFQGHGPVPPSSSSAPCPREPLIAPASSTVHPTADIQRVPQAASTSSPIQLSSQEKADLQDITGTEPMFFRQLATLLLKGTLGVNSQYERRKNAPPPRKSARLQQTTKDNDFLDHSSGESASFSQPSEEAVPHSIRAYRRYLDVVPGFVPIHQREDAIIFQPSVSHLSVDRVHIAMRQLNLGSQFVGMDGAALDRPKDSVPIEWFMRMNQASGAFKDYPMSSWTADFCLFSEEDLVHILYHIDTTRPILHRLLGGKDTQVDLVSKVLSQKGILIQSLLYSVGKSCNRRSRPSGYHHKLSLQSDPSDTKLKLRSVIRTNGLILHLLAYDTMDKRKRTAKEKGSTTAAGSSGLYDADDNDIDFLLDPAFLQDDNLLSTPEPSQSTTTSSSSSHLTAAYDPRRINFSRGSKSLENVEIMFDSPEHCPDYKDVKIVGVDLGEKILFCATR
ncbi:hypothetical protein BGZ95_007323, partial [Linnemannia exigua]